MLTKNAAIKTVERFVQEIKSSGLQLRKAVLYGSYANGRPHKWSDIDVALVADEFTDDEFENIGYFANINNKPDYSSISTRTYNSKKFTPRIDPFVEVIMEKGIEIAC